MATDTPVHFFDITSTLPGMSVALYHIPDGKELCSSSVKADY